MLVVLTLVEIVVWKSFALGWFEIPKIPWRTVLAYFGKRHWHINQQRFSLVNYPILADYGKFDLNKNLAKIFATVFSIVWNFTGYKVFVFRSR